MSSDLGSDGLPVRVGGSWTREKLIYLEKYAAAFMTAMGAKRSQGRWNQLVYLDPLSGPGVNLIEGEEHPGSPLIALSTLPRFDRLYFGDQDEENVNTLRQRLSAADVDRADVQQADCHVRARQIVDSLDSWKTLGLAFIDPEGFEVRFELFATLAERPIDILFLFPSGIGIKRNLERFIQQDHSPMDDLWGDRSWRDTAIARLLAGEQLTHQDAERLDDSWVLAFRQRVATLGYQHHDSTPPLRNDQRVPMYHLLFFSKDRAGLDIWRGISKIEPGGQRRLGF